MIPKPLTLEELAVIHDPINVPYFEIIKGMSLAELRAFDKYIPTDMKHYMSVQVSWIEEERYLIGRRFHPARKISDEALMRDMEKYHTPERFRTFYVLKYPDKISPLSNS